MNPADIFDFDFLKSYVLSLVPPPPVQYTVPAAQQQQEIESLKATLGGKRFFFVNNLERFETEQVHGVAQWLGYPEKEFTLKWYLDYVLHPGKRKSVILVAKQLYDSLCAGQHSLKFMVQRYSSLVALKHYKGHYLLANKISSVFQYDDKSRLTAYLNEFTIIGNYTEQALVPDFFNADGSVDSRGEQIIQAALQHFLSLDVFTDRQLQMARLMAYKPGIKKAAIAARMGVEESTIIRFGKDFKERADTFFDRSFPGVAAAATFVKNEGLL